jgi:Protein of unknown function (DUF2911)
MKKRVALTLGVSGLALLAFGGLAAAQNQQRASPHETITSTINGKKISITYGRPYKKGRVIFGGLEPWGKVWRTGADEATTITLEGDAMIGPLHVVAGTYSLFTIPNEKEWTLVLNKTAKQWGAFKYDAAMDYGRAPMKVSKPAAPVEQMTIAIEKKNDHEAVLKVMWDESAALIDIMVH